MSGQRTPGHVPATLTCRLAAELSLSARMRYVAVGLAGLCGAALIGALWVTEPAALPVRTEFAFGGLIAIGLAWAAFAGWVLSRRRPLYARDQVLAAWIALVATSATTGAGVALAAVRGTAAGVAAVALGGCALVAVAGVLLAGARSRHRGLTRLRDGLRGGRAGS